MPIPTSPRLPADLNAALASLAATYSANCELITLPERSAVAPGVNVGCIRIHDGTEPKDPAVLIVGGVHAREMAPPDALVRFAEALLQAYTDPARPDISFPPLTARAAIAGPPGFVSVSYPAYRIPNTQVQDIVRKLDLYLIPCVNPDGRRYDITHPGLPFGDGWRKNRRPNPDNAAPRAVGVDLNRNFDIAWDYHRYYDMPMYHTVYADDPASTVDTDELFNGRTGPVRTVTVQGSPTGGSFRLSFNGRTTTPIAFNAPAADMQSRLAALASIGPGNVTVTGAASGPYTVTFTGARAHPVPMLTANFSGLTGGTNPKVVITHARPTLEPETHNVQWLIDTKRIRFFLDIHQFGRAILLPWGLEDTGSDAAMNYRAGNWDGRRDGLLPAAVPAGRTDYQEYMTNNFPHYLKRKVWEIGTAMRDGILRAAGANLTAAPGADLRKDHSLYRVGTSARFYDPSGGPLTGSSDDYAFSRQFEDTSRAPIYSFTIEVGQDEELGFHPDYTAPNNHYPKIEREVHASVVEFLAAAVRWRRFCVVATAVYRSENHPDVEYLRHVRDDELRSTRFGRRFVAVMERGYYSFSPPLARLLHRHPRIGALVRDVAVRPAVWLLRALCWATAWLRPRELRIAVLATVLSLVLAAGAASVFAGLIAAVFAVRER